jgi:hypothetical protein
LTKSPTKYVRGGNVEGDAVADAVAGVEDGADDVFPRLNDFFEDVATDVVGAVTDMLIVNERG